MLLTKLRLGRFRTYAPAVEQSAVLLTKLRLGRFRTYAPAVEQSAVLS